MIARIPSVSPEDRIPFGEPLTRLVLSPAGRWFAINVASRIDPLLMRVTNGKLSCFGRAPVLLLAVRGRKSGELRTTPLLYYTEGDDVILVVSNFGRETHPAWYYNALAAPEVTLMSGGRSGAYRASEVTDEEERRRLFGGFERLTRVYSNYVGLAKSYGRQIRVLRFAPVH